jgi:hypothetical protein
MNTHRGSSFDAFLEEEGILEDVSAKAQKRLFALQLEDTMKAAGISYTKFLLVQSFHEGLTIRGVIKTINSV